MAKTDPTQENVYKLLAENRKFAEENVKLLREIGELKQEIRAKHAVLRAVEWMCDESGDEYCPYCLGKRPEDEEGGHHPDCALKAEVALPPVDSSYVSVGPVTKIGGDFMEPFTVTYHGYSGLPDELILNGMTYVKKNARDS